MPFTKADSLVPLISNKLSNGYDTKGRNIHNSVYAIQRMFGKESGTIRKEWGSYAARW